MDEAKLTEQIVELKKRLMDGVHFRQNIGELPSIEDVNFVRDCEVALGTTEARPDTVASLRLRLAVRLGLANTVQASKVRKGHLISIGGVTVRITKREKWRSSGVVRVYWEDVGEGFPIIHAKPRMFDAFQPDAELMIVTL